MSWRLQKPFSIVCTTWLLVACGGGGSSSHNSTPTPSPQDTTPPSIAFAPSAITLDAGSTMAVELSYSDNETTNLSPEITCQSGGEFTLASSTYQAQPSAIDLNTQCTASVSDQAGNTSEATLAVNIVGVVNDEQAPVIRFDPASIVVNSSSSAEFEIIASDESGETPAISIDCDAGEIINLSQYNAPSAGVSFTTLCTATATDNAQNQTQARLNIEVIGSGLIGLGIDPYNLANYANQVIPSYITHDNSQDNPITDIGASLGRVLFYDTKLSTNDAVSCASCHRQANGFSDLAPLSQGVNGPTRRHSMRLINTRFSEEEKFRWDEGAANLEAQMTMPIRDFAEMGFSGENGVPSFSDLINTLSAIDYYQDLFTRAFGDNEITEQRMQLALAQFVRSIQSFDSKYDQGRAQVTRHEDDFPNFTASENAGKRLFTEAFEYETDTIQDEGQIPVDGGGQIFTVSRRISGGLNCATCHRPPEFDIDPQSLNNGFIREAAPTGENPRGGQDLTVTRSPTLRDLMNTNGQLNGGMFHTGLSTTLIGIPAHYEFRRFVPENDNLDLRLLPNGLPQFLDITTTEQNQLFDFLRTLSGSNVYTNEKWSDPFNQ